MIWMSLFLQRVTHIAKRASMDISSPFCYTVYVIIATERNLYDSGDTRHCLEIISSLGISSSFLILVQIVLFRALLSKVLWEFSALSHLERVKDPIETRWRTLEIKIKKWQCRKSSKILYTINNKIFSSKENISYLSGMFFALVYSFPYK